MTNRALNTWLDEALPAWAPVCLADLLACAPIEYAAPALTKRLRYLVLRGRLVHVSYGWYRRK